MKKGIIVTTADEIPGKKVKEVIDVVTGNTVRSKDIFRDIGAALKNLVGGELKSYTGMIKDARTEAYNRMLEEAEKKGADAIIEMRFMTSMVSDGASEILAYGTAVKLD